MFLKILFIDLFMKDRQREREREEREAETQAEGRAGSMQGARRGTQSWVSRITPWAAGGAKPLRHRGCPVVDDLKYAFNSTFRDIWVVQRLSICL